MVLAIPSVAGHHSMPIIPGVATVLRALAPAAQTFYVVRGGELFSGYNRTVNKHGWCPFDRAEMKIRWREALDAEIAAKDPAVVGSPGLGRSWSSILAASNTTMLLCTPPGSVRGPIMLPDVLTDLMDGLQRVYEVEAGSAVGGYDVTAAGLRALSVDHLDRYNHVNRHARKVSKSVPGRRSASGITSTANTAVGTSCASHTPALSPSRSRQTNSQTGVRRETPSPCTTIVPAAQPANHRPGALVTRPTFRLPQLFSPGVLNGITPADAVRVSYQYRGALWDTVARIQATETPSTEDSRRVYGVAVARDASIVYSMRMMALNGLAGAHGPVNAGVMAAVLRDTSSIMPSDIRMALNAVVDRRAVAAALENVLTDSGEALEHCTNSVEMLEGLSDLDVERARRVCTRMLPVCDTLTPELRRGVMAVAKKIQVALPAASVGMMLDAKRTRAISDRLRAVAAVRAARDWQVSVPILVGILEDGAEPSNTVMVEIVRALGESVDARAVTAVERIADTDFCDACGAARTTAKALGALGSGSSLAVLRHIARRHRGHDAQGSCTAEHEANVAIVRVSNAAAI